MIITHPVYPSATVRPQAFYLRLVGLSRLPQCHQLLAGGVGFNELLIAGFSRAFVLSSDVMTCTAINETFGRGNKHCKRSIDRRVGNNQWAVKNPDREARLKPALALPVNFNHQLKLVALRESAKADCPYDANHTNVSYF